MSSIKSKYLYCPTCRSKLHKVKNTSNNELYSVCTNSTCRSMIKDNCITEMDIGIYSRVQQLFSFDDNKEVAYMLLRENLTTPLLSKLTNLPLESSKCMYNIIEAENREQAINKFRAKYKHLNIVEDMVVPVRIMEE